MERAVTGYFDYIEDLIERENVFTMNEFEKSVNAFLEFRQYKILRDNGKISHKQALEKASDLLVSAGSNIVTKCKDAHHWKKVFVDAGKFFIEHERYAEQIFDDISLVLSKENMLELAKALKHEDGYSIKNKLSLIHI